MIMAQPNQKIFTLQQNILSALGSHTRYCLPQLQEYEKKFKPHLTIAFDLHDRFRQAQAEIGTDVRCVGVLNEIVLSCVSKQTIEEATNPSNLTIYKI